MGFGLPFLTLLLLVVAVAGMLTSCGIESEPHTFEARNGEFYIDG
jgi:hypothetical protein